eukprot:8276266-Heterocapsa_arctica.AAC.1
MIRIDEWRNAARHWSSGIIRSCGRPIRMTLWSRSSSASRLAPAMGMPEQRWGRASTLIEN